MARPIVGAIDIEYANALVLQIRVLLFVLEMNIVADQESFVYINFQERKASSK
jgi:hypothetical protein